jgi:hypothetical protein
MENKLPHGYRFKFFRHFEAVVIHAVALKGKTSATASFI